MPLFTESECRLRAKKFMDKSHVVGVTNFKGLTIMIENPVGSIRTGVDAHGDKWQTKFHYPYGYIYGTKGLDKEGVDVFIGNNPASERVFIIHQTEGHGVLDEDKVMLGFSDRDQVRDAYLAHFSTQSFLGEITEMPFFEFREKLKREGKQGKTIDGWVTVKGKEENESKKDYRRILLGKGGKIIGGDVPKETQGTKIGSKEFKEKVDKVEEKKEATPAKQEKPMSAVIEKSNTQMSAKELLGVLGIPIVAKKQKKGQTMFAYVTNPEDKSHYIEIPSDVTKLTNEEIEGKLFHEIGHAIDEAESYGGRGNTNVSSKYFKNKFSNKAAKLLSENQEYILKGKKEVIQSIDFQFKDKQGVTHKFTSMDDLLKSDVLPKDIKHKFFRAYMDAKEKYLRYQQQPMELFADGFRKFVIEKDAMQKQSPELYSFYQQIFDDHPVLKSFIRKRMAVLDAVKYYTDTFDVSREAS